MQLTRRAALQGLVLASAFGGVNLASASTTDGDPNLIVVFLRGGLDALAAVPAYGDPHFAMARGPLAPLSGTKGVGMLKLDGFFALHPALGPLAPYFAAGELIIIPATGIAGVDRSHAAAQAALFDADIDDGGAGWASLASSEVSSPVPAVWRAGPSDRSIDLLSDLALANPLLDIAHLCSEPAWLPGSRCVDDLLEQRSASDAARFAEMATNAARTLATMDGPRIAMLELAGFDTHVAQGGGSGRLARALHTLADGLVSLAEASGSAWQRTVVMVVTEFGRSVAPNSDAGTDHGTASVTFLMGGAVAGGRIVGQWPGLAPAQLHGGTDLAATTDPRSIIKAALTEHLCLPERSLAKAFPGAAGVPTMRGLFRA